MRESIMKKLKARSDFLRTTKGLGENIAILQSLEVAMLMGPMFKLAM